MAQLYRLVDLSSERLNISPKYARCVVFGSAALPAVVWLANRLMAFRRRRAMRQKRLTYLQDLATQMDQIQNICESKITEERAVEITSLPFEDLQSKLQKGELLCVDVLYAYQRIAFSKNKELNFIVQPVLEAEETARRLDSLSPEERKNLPLFGIPISVKENYRMAGYFSTAGCSQLLECKHDHTSGLVQGLVNAGAVPFIRTNLSQTMMSLASHNPLYGQTRNPQDLSRSPGGSSCGEGAAIGSGSSLIGLGSDIGGSIRVPGAWCGIYGLKPTAGRFSVLNQTSGIYGQAAVKGTGGFMARDLNSIVEFTRAVSSDAQFNADHNIPRIYFHEQDYASTRPLTIGYAYEWPPIAVTESTKHAITKVLAGLSSQGHKVVEWNLPKFEDIPARFYIETLFGDGGVQLVNTLENDDVSYSISTMISILRIPAWIKRTLASTLGWAMPPWWTYKFLVGMSGTKDVDRWFRLQTKVTKYRQLWIDDWKKQGIDVLIVPAVPVPAELIDEKRGCSSGCGGYVFPLNLVNFPAGVVPFGKITKEDEENDFASYPDFDIMHRRLKEMIPGSAGLALSIQCVALPYREEVCLRAMNLVSTISPT